MSYHELNLSASLTGNVHASIIIHSTYQVWFALSLLSSLPKISCEIDMKFKIKARES